MLSPCLAVIIDGLQVFPFLSARLLSFLCFLFVRLCKSTLKSYLTKFSVPLSSDTMDTVLEKERNMEDKTRNLITRLPMEIALDIVSRLPVTCLIRFRFVCQTWNRLTHDSRLVKLHLSRALKINPCLIFKNYQTQKEQFFFVELSDDYDDEHVLREIQMPFSISMEILQLVDSCNGLLCLSGVYDYEAVYIYNPFTREHERLPNCNKREVNEVVYGFGFHPATDEYKVIKIGYYPHIYYAPWCFHKSVKYDNPLSEVHVFSLESNTWRNLGELPYKLHHSPGVLVSGRLHWVTRYNWHLDRLIVAFDLSDDTFQEVPKPDFNVNLFQCSYHLAALRGCLCACLLTSNGENLEIWVMEEYNKKESWVKEINITVNSLIVGEDLGESFDIWRTRLRNGSVKVMCLLKNGDILLDCQATYSLLELETVKHQGFRFSQTRNFAKESKPEDDTRNLITCLPNEIALNVVSRLPIISLIQFRFVCKAWKMLTHDSRLVDLRASNNNPCLIIKTCQSQKKRLFFVELSDHDHNNEHILREIQIPFSISMGSTFQAIGSCNSLLCLHGVDDHEAVYIYNSFTREHKKLPNCNEFEVNEVVYGFGFHPTTNEYKVIKIGYYPLIYYATWSPGGTTDHNLPCSEVHVFSLGSNSWRSLGELPYKLHRSPGVLVSGKLHWVTRYNWHVDRLIVAFDLSTDTFQEVPRPDFNVNLFRCSYHLAALRGCLCSCLLNSNGDNLEIWIMEEYNNKDSWVKKFNIRVDDSIVGRNFPQSYYILSSTQILKQFTTSIQEDDQPRKCE